MLTHPKVTIVIPAHNEEGYITKCIEACLNQDYQNKEIIVIDNASTDKTYDIASQYPIKVLKEERKGTLFARAHGTDISTGDLIATVDADCIPEKTWLSSGVTYLNNKKVVAVSGPYFHFDAPFIPKYFTYFWAKYIYSFINLCLSSFGQNGIVIGGNTLFRKEALLQSGGFDTSITFWGDDVDTAKRLATQGKIIFSPSFVMNSSYRRFKKEGFFRTTFLYQLNYLKYTLRK